MALSVPTSAEETPSPYADSKPPASSTQNKDSIYADMPFGLKGRMGAGFRKQWKPSPRIATPYDKAENGTIALAGLGQGMTVLVGEAGGGKSTFAKTAAIASAMQGIPTIYVYAESYADGDSLPDLPNLHKMDYVGWLPNASKAIDQVLGRWEQKGSEWSCAEKGAAQYVGAKVIILDSVTTFLSGTTKAVSEADVRDGAFKLNKIGEASGISIIGISQVRGSGQYQSYAGGAAVGHAGMAVIQFEMVKVQAKWDAERYNVPEGTRVYTMTVNKDRSGKSNSKDVFVIDYPNELEPRLKAVSGSG